MNHTPNFIKFRVNSLRFDTFIQELSQNIKSGKSLSELERQYTNLFELIQDETSCGLTSLSPDDPWRFVLEKILNNTRMCQSTIHKNPITEHLPRVDFLMIIYNRSLGQSRRIDWLIGGYEKQIIKIAQQVPISTHPQQKIIHRVLGTIKSLADFAIRIEEVPKIRRQLPTP